ncbi:anthranilate phosphoribosyltransferase, partial [Neptunomonas sp.]|uniref:anthranilate phosphoribosyltransferase n=1 Tax=Neptunomonas sp. TaxID=1971898 RepID=UPI0035625A4C
MDIKQALTAVVDRKDLSMAEMQAVMQQIMSGQATDAQIGGLLIALRMKGETVDEITAAASVMRSLAVPVNIQAENAVDIVGTGGDSANLFNVSSACSFVVAAAGGHVAKHGNRSVSSSSGSADLLEAAGVNLQLTPDQIARCIDNVGVGFMFAPQHHSAMKYAIGPRKEMS